MKKCTSCNIKYNTNEYNYEKLPSIMFGDDTNEYLINNIF